MSRSKELMYNLNGGFLQRKITLQIYNKTEEYTTFDIDGLDFNHQKHISSKIVKNSNITA